MVGHIDCNTFFVSCERLFRPDLEGRPVVVLSNNDGCICALSREAKALGIRRGDPYFKVRQVAEAGGVTAFSGNHRLYADISSRVMDTLRELSDNVEVYSVDDAFIDIPSETGTDTASLQEYGRYVVWRIRRNVGIPVSMGVAPTKTLAKLAGHFAKNYPAYRGAAVMDTPQKAQRALAMTDVSDIWGIGRRLADRLHRRGIVTAWQLAQTPKEKLVALGFNVTYLRTWQELRGEPSIAYEWTAPMKQTVTCSRTFARELTEMEPLRQAMAGFAAIVSRKLRREGSCALELCVYTATNRFNEHIDQRCDSARAVFPEATSDTLAVSRAAIGALHRIHPDPDRPTVPVKKAGLIITSLCPADQVQMTLFGVTQEQRSRSRRLMKALDMVNSRWPDGMDGVTVARAHARGLDGLVRRDNASHLYTTRLSEILHIKV